MKRNDNNNSASIKLAASAVVFAGLYYGKPILVPIASAALLSLFLRPVVNFLERFIGRVGAVVASVALSIALLGAAGYGMGAKIASMSSQIPAYTVTIKHKAEALNKWAGEAVQFISEMNTLGAKQGETESADGKTKLAGRVETSEQLSVTKLLTSVLGPLLEPLEIALIVLIFTIFILLQRDDLRNRVVHLAGKRKMHATSQAFDEAGMKLSRYLLMQSITNLVYGAIIAVGLSVMGMSDGIVWGALAAVLRFIPYIGTWISAIPPFVILLATTTGWQPAYALMLFLALDLVFPTIIEPLIIGTGVGISPLSLLVAAVFWTFLWGPVGLLLSTPLTVCLAVMGKHAPALKFLNILLTDKSVLDAKARFYQRLLSSNPSGATDLVQAEREKMSVLRVCDELLVPVLALAERDLHAGRIDESKAKIVRETVSAWVAKEMELDDGERNEKVSSSGILFSDVDLKELSSGAVLCVPAHNSADEVSAQLFAAVLQGKRLPAVAMPVNLLASEVLRFIAECKAGVVCICALPPFATSHSRYLYKRIRSQFPEIVIVVGLWNRKSDLSRSRRQVACAPGDGVVFSFATGLDYINQNLGKVILQNRIASGVRKVQPTALP